MTDPLLVTGINIHYRCLDLFPIEWTATGSGKRSSESGILVEIWRAGGRIHTSVTMAEGTLLEFAPAGQTIQGQVDGCEPDDTYGFLVTVSISPDQRVKWFPQTYYPPQLYDDQEKQVVPSLPPGKSGDVLPLTVFASGAGG